MKEGDSTEGSSVETVPKKGKSKQFVACEHGFFAVFKHVSE